MDGALSPYQEYSIASALGRAGARFLAEQGYAAMDDFIRRGPGLRGGAGAGAGRAAIGKPRMVLPLIKGGWVGKKSARRVGRPAGPIDLVRRQLSLGITNWCDQSITSATRLTGTINSQLVQTLARTCNSFLRASTLTSGNRWESFALLTDRVASGGTYFNNASGCVLDTYTPVRSDAVPAAVASPLPRQTWELGTVFQLRDYLSSAYSLLITPTAVAGGSLTTGYIPPHVGTGPTNYPLGFPDFSAAGASGAQVPFARTQVSDAGTNLAYMKVFERNCPLYLASESIQFNFRNPTEQVQYVTMYELVPREDVPMAQILMGTDQANMGAWPDPKYLWDEWLRVYESDTMPGVADAPVDAPDTDVIQTADLPAATVTVDAVSVYVPAKPIRTKNTCGMRPGHLVHKFYHVRQRMLKLDAGCSGAMSFTLQHNRVLKYQDLFTTYARANRSALYMMRVRGERLISKATAGASQTADGYCAPDILVEWRKSAKFCKFQMRPTRHCVYVSRPIRSDITAQYDVDPESGDAEQTNTIS